MANFHIGDKVCVLYKGAVQSGTITDIVPGQPPESGLYQLDGEGPYWDSSRLDYDITEEQKVLLQEGERVTWELFAAAKDADRFWLKAKDGGVPPTLLAAYRRKIQEIVAHFAKQAP